MNMAIGGYPRIPMQGVLKLPHFIAKLANTTAGVAVRGFDDPVVGTTVHECVELFLVRW